MQGLAVAALVLVVVALVAVQQRLITTPVAMEAFLAEAEAVPITCMAGEEETPVVVVVPGISTPTPVMEEMAS